jgi:coenzyme F420 hydrogenase subunit beta
MNDQKINIQTVVDNNACVGCGACAFVTNSDMAINEYGEYVPQIDKMKSSFTSVKNVCPSLNPELNEDKLAESLFPDAKHKYSGLGSYLNLWGGYVSEKSFRSDGTSGGTGTWIGYELLRKGLIDGIIHVKASERVNENDPYYVYSVSYDIESALKCSRTRYHVVEFSKALEEAISSGGRYLFIGVPCQVKAIRKLQLIDKRVDKAIAYTMSLVCGHMKSINWTNSLSWGADIKPKNSTSFQYRTKGEGIPARAYMFTAYGKKDGHDLSTLKDSSKVVGGKFNLGALMLPACEWCDDVVGETADITVGDAWIPRFESDENGNNLVIVRNKKIDELIKDAISENRLKYTNLSPKEAWESQAGGFRQRGEGLSHRLDLRSKKGLWAPQKRIKPGAIPLTYLRKKIYELRSEVTYESRTVFREALVAKDFTIYEKKLGDKIRFLRKLELFSVFFKALKNKIERKYYSLKNKRGN